MTQQRMVELLEIEKECVRRNACGECNRACYICDLLQDDTELHEMYEEVIALLKAQEPRVMTYDELNRLHTDDVIWLEDIDKAEVIPAIVCGAPDYSSILDTVELCAYYRNKYISVITKDYLERWRCWTSRPDQTTREATPWA